MLATVVKQTLAKRQLLQFVKHAQRKNGQAWNGMRVGWISDFSLALLYRGQSVMPLFSLKITKIGSKP